MSVKIVGLDESGKFEKRNEEDTRFVGGYTLNLDDEGENARNELKTEIKNLLKTACKVFNRCAHRSATKRYSDEADKEYEVSISSKSTGKSEMLNLMKIMKSFGNGSEQWEKMSDEWNIKYPLSAHGCDCVFFKEIERFDKDGKKIKSQFKPYWRWRKVGAEAKEIPTKKVLYTRQAFYDDDHQLYLKWERFFYNFIQKVVLDFLKIKENRFFCFMYPEMRIANDDVRESNILNFTSGANLYEYMAQAAVMNEIMYYPEQPYGRYALELATRSQYIGNIKENLDNYTAQGAYANITDKGTYRTAIANMLNLLSWSEPYKNVQYDVDVVSIKYNDRAGSDCMYIPEDDSETPFHYLADIVCNRIRKTIFKQILSKQGSVSKTMISLAESWNPIPIEIRVLGEADLLYRRMIAALHEYKLADYYRYWYDLKNLKDKHGYSDFYIEYWVKKKLEPMRVEYMHNWKTGNAIITELSAGYETVKNMMFNQQYDKMMYVALQIKKDLSDSEFSAFIRNNSYLDLLKFRFNGMILRGYNHHGNISEAQKIIDECENNATKVSPEEYLDFTVCTVEYYFNTFQYEEVIKRYERLALTKSNLWFKNYDGSNPLIENSLLDQLCNCLDMVRRGASVQEEPQWIKLKDMHVAAAGRINSCLGQAYAFAQNWDTAGRELKMKSVFEKAMDIFNEDGDNKDITLCHYLHALISLADKKSFEENAASYFGVKSYDVEAGWNALSGAIANSNYRFAIYLYIRAFRVFYATDENKGLFEKILNQILAVSDKIGKEHPWQLIYMNLYKIAKHYQMADKLDALKEKVYSAVADPFFTIDMININFELQCMEDVESFSFGDKIGEWMEKNAKKNEDSSLYKLLKKYCQGDDTEDTDSQYIKKFFKIQADSTFQDLKNALEKVCTYEYC